MVEVMMTLFALVVVGYIAGKLGYLGGDFDRQLSRLWRRSLPASLYDHEAGR